MSRLPFISSIPKDVQEKQLRKTPKQIKAVKNYGKNRARKKKARERRNKRNRAFEKLIEGRWYALKKLYGWRQRKNWLGGEWGFEISLEEWLYIWEQMDVLYGFSYKDRGLGRDDEYKEKSKWASSRRRSFNSLKFGRVDAKLPFVKGNCCVYVQLSKDDLDIVLKQGIQTNAGLILPKEKELPRLVDKPHARLVLFEF